MRSKGVLLACLCACLLAYPAQKAIGQAVFGSILGTVSDPSGAAVPGAKVSITNIGQGVSYATTTNTSGNYEQTHLIPGNYSVRIEATGFQSFIQQSVTVNVDAVAKVDATLTVGAVTQEITVTGAVPLLKTSRTDVATTFSTRSVEDLPLLNRNFTQFELLTPGTQRLGWQHASSENPQGSIQIMVNGQHFSGTSFQLDGTDNRDPILGIIVINPNLDAVTEAKVTSQNYDAEFGQATAGVVTAQTKSGTNEVHGSAFWFRRDNNFAARDPFSQSVPISGSNNRFLPDLLRNQIGGSLGGPIKKDKTFIFGDFQLTHITNGGSVLTRVPTAAERAGDLRGLGVDIFDPGPTGNTDPALRTQFTSLGNPGIPDGTPNVIPLARLSPQAQALMAFLPSPNLAATGSAPNFSTGGSEIFNTEGFDIRGDQYQTDKTHIFGRYSFQRFKRQGPGAFGTIAGGPAFDGINFAGQSSVKNQSIAAGFDHTLNPTWLTDFRFGFYRYFVIVNPNGAESTPAIDANAPGLNLGTPETAGMPAFFINGTGGFNFGYSLGNNQCNCPLDQEEQQWQFVNNWTNSRGNHTIKFGADIRYAQNLRVPSDKHRAGELSFNDAGTEGPGGGGLGIASFLLGNVNFFERFISKTTNAGERQKRWFFYGQDTWRATNKLTLSYGLRWEIYFPQTVTGDGLGGFVQPATGEVWVAGSNGIGRNGNVQNTLKNFAPRVGLAYELTDKTVVRAGYGRSFDVGVFGSTFGHSVTQNVPVLASQQTQGPNGNNFETAFNLSAGPPSLDPAAALETNCNSITDPSGTQTQCLGATGRPFLPDGINSYVLPFKMRLPTVDAWNLTVQHQLTNATAIEIAYVGNKGTHVFAGDGPDYDFNQPTEIGFGTLSGNQRKPFFSAYGWTQGFRYFGNDSNDSYHSIQTKVEKRFTNGYQFVAHYTLSRAYNHDSNYWPIDGSVNYGPTDWQRTHVFVLNNIVELPFGHGHRFGSSASKAVDYVIGGWQVNAITSWESGLPFTPGYRDCGADRDNGPCRPSVVGPTEVSNPSQSGWFVPAGGELASNGQTLGPWQRPGIGQFGNVRRNSFRGPGLFNTDLSLFKSFTITERVKGQFRAEFNNFWNKVNLGNPDSTVDNDTAGQIFGLTSGAVMRQVQFAIRFDF
jgi:outer membrane receptor protein involved in Fe transport